MKCSNCMNPCLDCRIHIFLGAEEHMNAKDGTIMDVEIKSSSQHEFGHSLRNVEPLDKNTIFKWRIGIARS